MGLPSIKSEYNMEVYLLVWSHKHGHDYYCFSSEESAYAHGIEIMRNTLYEWGEEENYSSVHEEDLWNSWGEISGDTEYFEIIPLDMDPIIV